MEGWRLGCLKKILYLFALCVFVAGCATAYDKRGVYHKVRKGESIQKIARYYHVPVQDLAEWNNIQDDKEILPGLKLYVPRTKESRPLKYKKLPESERAGFDAPIQFDRSRFIWPVAGSVISPFGIRNGKRHDGVDIKAEKGTPIRAASGGKVAFSGRLQGYGNMIIIRHEDNFFTVYAHNSKNSVNKEEKVTKGQVVGYVGATGRATGPHVHFEVREGQKARNPLFLLPASGTGNEMIAKKERPHRKEKVEDLRTKRRR